MRRHHAVILASAFLASPIRAEDKPPTLPQYLELLKASPGDDTLRRTIIQRVLRMEPRPSLPEGAIKASGAAKYALKDAKSTADFALAAEQYEKALLLAPWHADYYYNLGLCQEKAERFTDAVRNLKLYLAAAPSAKDAEKVQERIGGLEFVAEKHAAQASERASFSRLAGLWKKSSSGGDAQTYRVSIDGPSIEIAFTETCSGGQCWDFERTTGRPEGVWKGTLDGFRFKGSYTMTARSNAPGYACVETTPMTGSVGPDFQTIRFEYSNHWPAGNCGQLARSEVTLSR